MKKPLTICNRCRKPKDPNCKECKPVAFTGINKSNYDFYNSHAWRKKSKKIRKRDPLCVICLENGRTTPSEMVDHTIPIDKGGELMDEANLRGLCHKCHNKKTGRSK